MDSALSGSGPAGWIHKLGPLGAVVFGLGLLIIFFASSDSGETSAELIAYAEDKNTELWFLQIFALLVPILIGPLVASLWVRLRTADEALRALTLIGGTLFIAFLSTGLTLWAAPLLENSELSDAGAQAYLTFDDAGWVLLGLSGISIGVMIVGVSLAAIDLGWVPKWAGWVSLALGVLSLATIVAVGLFAFTIWLIAAGLFLLLRKNGAHHAAPTRPDLG